MKLDFHWLFWDTILPQALLQLNLLQISNAIPTMSAHVNLCSHHNYNVMPVLLIELSAKVHIKKANCKSWYLFIAGMISLHIQK